MSQPVLIIHGGTGGQPSAARVEAIRSRLRTMCDEAYAHLASHTALETVALAVRRLEDDPLFNAGTGSVVQADGVARMSASIMRGVSLRFAGVLNVERARHPIDLAVALLDEEDRVLAGEGATKYATTTRRLSDVGTITASTSRRRDLRHGAIYDTVGAVALDRRGHLAAATSTGGKRGQRAGRVSDSGLPVGNYATRDVAVSCTGIGEEIIEEGLAVRIAQQVADGFSLSRACARTFRQLRARKRRIGAIALDRHGVSAMSTTFPVLFAITRRADRRIESF